MIDVKQAVNAAIAYVNDFPSLLSTANVRLEETELSDTETYWNITLSFIENALMGTRTYRIFKIDAETGVVKSMKARNIFKQA